jgi:hypothetical protein
MQKVGDCDFFGWADNEMSTYEKKKMMEHLTVTKEKTEADFARLEKLIETKFKKNIYQTNQLRLKLEN